MSEIANSASGSIPASGLAGPVSTYRWQFHAGFTFAHARQLADYLRELGVGTCYASPVFQARAGSTHGYDVCDFRKFNDELGGGKGFEALAAALREQGLRLLLDMVPNHMGIGDPRNLWWEDVLEHGRNSPFALFFDIDWQSAASPGRVLLPALGDRFGTVLEAGQLQLTWADGRLWIVYFDRRLPVSAAGYQAVLAHMLADTRLACRDELRAIHDTLADSSGVPAGRAAGEKARLARLIESSPGAQAVLKDALSALNGAPGQPASFNALQHILDLQHYRLAFWRLASSRLNYRRFFDITDLAGLCVERSEVFTQAHELVINLAAEGVIVGLRIDHPDGLRDPAAYFDALQVAVGRRRAELGRASETSGPAGSVFVVAEKILASDEPLPEDWALHGTTGYEFLNLLNGLFIDPAAEPQFSDIYRRFSGGQDEFGEVERASKRLVMTSSLRPEMEGLAQRLEALAQADRHCRDLSPEQVRDGLMEFLSALEIYRTYVRPGRPALSAEERRRVRRAADAARQRRPDLAPLFSFVSQLLESPGSPDQGGWTLRFQQLSGPVMAKGVEDTAFYRYNRFLSLNEVGGHPAHFGCGLEQFHRENGERQRKWPFSMLATATHDTKRSEDLRARLNVLCELASEWGGAVDRWHAQCPRKDIGSMLVPDPNTEYLFYQTLAGVWPVPWPDPGQLTELRKRVWGALLKSVREAKVHTSWLDSNEAYEKALEEYVTTLLADPERHLPGFGDLVERLAFFGRWNSLSQVLLKATAPGVPDFYQGCELWDLSMVDPDNRRDVDYDRRRRLLAELAGTRDLAALAGSLVEHAVDGRIKLFLTHRVLRFRREHSRAFASADYVPLRVDGSRREHVIAFARVTAERAFVVAAPRWTARLTQGRLVAPVGPEIWGDTTLQLPGGFPARYAQVFTEETVAAEGSRLSLGAVFARYPFALLSSQSGPQG